MLGLVTVSWSRPESLTKVLTVEYLGVSWLYVGCVVNSLLHIAPDSLL